MFDWGVAIIFASVMAGIGVGFVLTSWFNTKKEEKVDDSAKDSQIYYGKLLFAEIPPERPQVQKTAYGVDVDLTCCYATISMLVIEQAVVTGDVDQDFYVAREIGKDLQEATDWPAETVFVYWADAVRYAEREVQAAKDKLDADDRGAGVVDEKDFRQ